MLGCEEASQLVSLILKSCMNVADKDKLVNAINANVSAALDEAVAIKSSKQWQTCQSFTEYLSENDWKLVTGGNVDAATFALARRAALCGMTRLNETSKARISQIALVQEAGFAQFVSPDRFLYALNKFKSSLSQVIKAQKNLHRHPLDAPPLVYILFGIRQGFPPPPLYA